MKYSKNKINGVIIDYDLLGEIQDIKTERINNPIEIRNRVLSIERTINPNWYDNTTEKQRMLWMQAEKKYLEKLQWMQILSRVLEQTSGEDKSSKEAFFSNK